MASLEKFVKKITGSEPAQIGDLGNEVIDPCILGATRRHLVLAKMAGGRKRRGSPLPEVIIYDQFWRFVIDGHHKVKRACDQLTMGVECRALRTTDPRIKAVLWKRVNGFVSDLEFR